MLLDNRTLLFSLVLVCAMMALSLAILVLISLPYEDFRSRLVAGSLIFGAQMLMMVQILLKDTESRTGRAWLLLFWATAAMLPMFVLRAISAYFGIFQFAEPQTAVAPNPVQLAIFAGFVSLSILGSLGFILMIKEKADRAIRSLAMIDSLTGIHNRRAFMGRAEQEYAIAQRHKRPLALLMVDVDHFKRINDEYGHPTGDAVLVEVARILGSRLRKQDTLGRFSGEEFCILLPSTEEAGAMILAEKIRAAVADAVLLTAPREISVTISVGVTVCQSDCANCMQSFQKLIDDADTALYHAKHEGRNRASILPIGCRELMAA